MERFAPTEPKEIPNRPLGLAEASIAASRLLVAAISLLSFVRRSVVHMGWEPNRDITLVKNGNALNSLHEDALLGSAMLFAMPAKLKL
jgi:hypothetical protein